MGHRDWGKFRENPKTDLGWWAAGLGLVTFFVPPLLGTFAAVGRPLVDALIGETAGRAVGFLFGFGALGLSVAALVVSLCAYRRGERSWAVWFGLIPSILIAAFWIFMVVGELMLPH